MDGMQCVLDTTISENGVSPVDCVIANKSMLHKTLWHRRPKPTKPAAYNSHWDNSSNVPWNWILRSKGIWTLFRFSTLTICVPIICSRKEFQGFFPQQRCELNHPVNVVRPQSFQLVFQGRNIDFIPSTLAECSTQKVNCVFQDVQLPPKKRKVRQWGTQPIAVIQPCGWGRQRAQQESCKTRYWQVIAKWWINTRCNAVSLLLVHCCRSTLNIWPNLVHRV